MSPILLALLLSTAFCGVLALSGVRPYVDEFRSPSRQVMAFVLLVAILTLTVFGPMTSYGNLAAAALEGLTVLDLLLGHVIITVFLALWWVLRGDLPVSRFIGLSSDRLGAQIVEGVTTGVHGWVMTILVMMTVVTLLGQTEAAPDASTVSEVMPWMTKLPWAQKLLIVAAAMSVEEIFFRAFLQARVGLVVSSMLFALGHFSYGMPYMIIGVFTISVVIGRTFARSGQILPCMVAHGVFDAIQLFVILPYAVRMMEAGSVVAP